MKLPIGYSDFKAIIEQKFDFVDKSLLIKEIMDDAQVVLITRPRRFGKTLNMSMLYYFFSLGNQDTSHLFDNLKIAEDKELLLTHQNQYPVIYLTFKDVKGQSYLAAREKIIHIISSVYDQFSKVLLNSDVLTDFQKNNINVVLNGQASDALIENSLHTLSKALHDHYGKKVCIFIDEYDTAIQTGYLNGCYDEIVGFIRNLFSVALKDNPYLFKSVLTGILRVSRESLFSGLNNLKVYSIFQQKYGEYFGFTPDEVANLLAGAKLEQKLEDIKTWYNGYQMGNQIVYNPWSIVNCIEAHGVIEPYWVNTSDNALIKSLLLKSNEGFKQGFEWILQGNSVERVINENFVFADLNKYNESAIWCLLLMTGYLKINSYQRTDQGLMCQLSVPNKEIRNLFTEIFYLCNESI